MSTHWGRPGRMGRVPQRRAPPA